jgi:hypothetical protein
MQNGAIIGKWGLIIWKTVKIGTKLGKQGKIGIDQKYFGQKGIKKSEHEGRL